MSIRPGFEMKRYHVIVRAGVGTGLEAQLAVSATDPDDACANALATSPNYWKRVIGVCEFTPDDYRNELSQDNPYSDDDGIEYGE